MLSRPAGRSPHGRAGDARSRKTDAHSIPAMDTTILMPR